MIEVASLEKYYGAIPAVRDVSFSIRAGEIVGFLGLNGAGKTTVLKILCAELPPTSGRVALNGFDVFSQPHEVRRRVGFVPDTPPLYNEMEVESFLAFVAALRDVERKRIRVMVDAAIAKTGLGDRRKSRIATLSHGYRQRVALAQALVHSPRLLVLDEPTSGLDPAQIVELRSVLLDLRGQHTVLMSSHILSEIDQTCDRLLVIHRGEIVAEGTKDAIAARLRPQGNLEIDVRANPERALEVARAVPGVGEASARPAEGGMSLLTLEAGPEVVPQVLRALVAAGLDVQRMVRVVPPLESLFLELTKNPQVPS